MMNNKAQIFPELYFWICTCIKVQQKYKIMLNKTKEKQLKCLCTNRINNKDLLLIVYISGYTFICFVCIHKGLFFSSKRLDFFLKTTTVIILSPF